MIDKQLVWNVACGDMSNEFSMKYETMRRKAQVVGGPGHEAPCRGFISDRRPTISVELPAAATYVVLEKETSISMPNGFARAEYNRH